MNCFGASLLDTGLMLEPRGKAVRLETPYLNAGETRSQLRRRAGEERFARLHP